MAVKVWAIVVVTVVPNAPGVIVPATSTNPPVRISLAVEVILHVPDDEVSAARGVEDEDEMPMMFAESAAVQVMSEDAVPNTLHCSKACPIEVMRTVGSRVYVMPLQNA